MHNYMKEDASKLNFLGDSKPGRSQDKYVSNVDIPTVHSSSEFQYEATSQDA